MHLGSKAKSGSQQKTHLHLHYHNSTLILGSKARRYSQRTSTKSDLTKSGSQQRTHLLPIAELISTVWTLNQNLALYGQKMEGDEKDIQVTIQPHHYRLTTKIWLYMDKR